MIFSVSRFWGVALLLAGLTLSGCLPSAPNQADEEKELHFLEGRSRVNSLDWAGAIESFEKALEANPQSASAHFELGWLFDNKEPDPAAAIYHYNKYLALRPRAENAVQVKDRILACKQELARAVSLGPITEKQQHDLDKLAEENRQLNEQVKQLNEELTKWRAYYGSQAVPSPNGLAPASTAQRPPPSGGLTPLENGDGSASAPSPGSHAGPTAPPVHTHVIKPGETLSIIARKYGVKVEALTAINPRLDPRRMRPGQTLIIP
jgi:tetratricopeptide (TPR) repeat protein